MIRTGCSDQFCWSRMRWGRILASFKICLILMGIIVCPKISKITLIMFRICCLSRISPYRRCYHEVSIKWFFNILKSDRTTRFWLMFQRQLACRLKGSMILQWGVFYGLSRMFTWSFWNVINRLRWYRWALLYACWPFSRQSIIKHFGFRESIIKVKIINQTHI